ncbi:APC family permease [Mycoplasma struthionis]|uniref:APC family permease n=1 Tax=Mycoplasma struthionis TaxID=538220 RepID=A0A3G8LHS0_9MOLU|nr:APC family permease [Mycoplasma struthionis]AZG68412.1 APC family permease [Mycoplasma struthionis]TPI03102.1 APC family permease [Mycoplasma struthionis]
MNEEQLVVTSSPSKKIGFFSAILVVLGSSIGVGIFLRSKAVLENSAGNIAWAAIVWLIAGFAVVTMALALVEVASGRNDNLGMIGWAKVFTTLYIYKGTKFFMTYLYLPFTYFFMPYYVILQFQDGISGFGGNPSIGSTSSAPWIYFAIGLVLTLWMIFSAGISGRAGNVQNWIITSVKFIPLVAVVAIGIAFAILGNHANEEKTALLPSTFWKNVTAKDLFDKNAGSFFGLSPFFATFSSLGAIFFAFDGFYVTAGIQSEMKEPKKTPLALTIGLLSMTVLYIVIATAMTLGAGTGGFYGFQDLLTVKKAGWVFGVVNVLIAIGVLGILNGFTMWATRFVEDLIKEGEIFVPVSAYRYLKNSKTPWVGAFFCLALSLPIMILFTAIGAFAYIDASGYGDGYGYKIGQLLSFSDLMSNWMAIFAFMFICAAIVGAILNRKSNRVAVEKTPHLYWAGISSVVIITLTMLFNVLDPFISMGINSVKYITTKDGEVRNALISNVATSGLFLFFLVVTFLSTPIEKQIAIWNKKRFDRILSGNICPHEREYYCPCVMQDYKERAELNNLVLATYGL